MKGATLSETTWFLKFQTRIGTWNILSKSMRHTCALTVLGNDKRMEADSMQMKCSHPGNMQCCDSMLLYGHFSASETEKSGEKLNHHRASTSTSKQAALLFRLAFPFQVRTEFQQTIVCHVTLLIWVFIVVILWFLARNTYLVFVPNSETLRI